MNKIITIIIIVLIVLVGGIMLWLPTKIDKQEQSNQSVINQETAAVNKLGSAIKISPITYDLGTVIYGEVAKHEFTITNIGVEPLKILKLSTSCSCTSAAMLETDKTVNPGKSVPLIVSFDPAVHKDDTDLGELTRVIYIKSNDSNKPEVEVTITAFVIKAGSTISRENNQVKNFDIVAKQWEFVPNIIKVKQGDKVKLEIISHDVTHSFALPEFNIDARLEPSQETVVEFVADKKGTFDFRCAVFCGEGHPAMKGQLIVE